MKINRNTINGDISYWYSKILQGGDIFNASYKIIIYLERLDVQRSRLREQLDKAETFQERLALERLILEIDSKILNTITKLTNSTQNLVIYSTEQLNQWLKENKKDKRYLTLFDKISVSEKAREKINKIIKEDNLHKI